MSAKVLMKANALVKTSTLALVLALLPAAGVASAPTQRLSVEEAVRMSLASNAEISSADWDLAGARALALAAKLRMVPSVSLSGTYQHLSDTPATTLTIPPFPPYLTQPFSVDLPSNFKNQTDTGALILKMQYPVFAGFRLQEASRIAELRSISRAYAAMAVRRALTFEVQRAYWETARAEAAISLVGAAQTAAEVAQEDTEAQAVQGLATESDVMNARMQADQARISLEDAAVQRNRAYLALASLMGQDVPSEDIQPTAMRYELVSDPGAVPPWAAVSSVDLTRAESEALANRPEIRLSGLAIEIAEHAEIAARAGLYPTISLVGDYSLSNPNPRILVSAFDLAPGFYGTWEVGVQLSYDIGSVPASAAQARAASADAQKARAEAKKQADGIILDVRSTSLSLARARQDLSLSRSAVDPAEANLRLQKERQGQGVARRADVVNAELVLARARFAVASREIDLQIAAADFARAVGLESNAK